MLAFPNAKINLGLQVLRKRPDGFHDIISCIYHTTWCDVLEIVPAEELEMKITGLDIPGDPKQNLCLKAYQLLKTQFAIPPVLLHLHKVIPMGAGLGGGSSDGAYALKMLNELFQLKLSNEQLAAYAARLGSDCPFFIENKPALATETGTTLQPYALDLSGYHLVIVYPPIHVSTKEAYSGVSLDANEATYLKALSSPPEEWKDQLVNSFEASIFPTHPEIAAIKKQLYQSGATYASMTGSGAAVFGIFSEEPDLHFSSEQYIVWSGQLG